MNIVWRLVLAAVAIWLAIAAVKFVIGLTIGLLTTAVWIAVIVGVIWLLVQIFGQKKAY